MTRIYIGLCGNLTLMTLSDDKSCLECLLLHLLRTWLSGKIQMALPLSFPLLLRLFKIPSTLMTARLVGKAISLWESLQKLFARGRFILCKWNSSSQEVLEHIPPDLREQKEENVLPSAEGYPKTLCLEWNSHLHSFRLTISDFPNFNALTKRQLLSDVAKVFDALG